VVIVVDGYRCCCCYHWVCSDLRCWFVLQHTVTTFTFTFVTLTVDLLRCGAIPVGILRHDLPLPFPVVAFVAVVPTLPLRYAGCVPLPFRLVVVVVVVRYVYVCCFVECCWCGGDCCWFCCCYVVTCCCWLRYLFLPLRWFCWCTLLRWLPALPLFVGYVCYPHRWVLRFVTLLRCSAGYVGLWFCSILHVPMILYVLHCSFVCYVVYVVPLFLVPFCFVCWTPLLIVLRYCSYVYFLLFYLLFWVVDLLHTLRLPLPVYVAVYCYVTLEHVGLFIHVRCSLLTVLRLRWFCWTLFGCCLRYVAITLFVVLLLLVFCVTGCCCCVVVVVVVLIVVDYRCCWLRSFSLPDGRLVTLFRYVLLLYAFRCCSVRCCCHTPLPRYRYCSTVAVVLPFSCSRYVVIRSVAICAWFIPFPILLWLLLLRVPLRCCCWRVPVHLLIDYCCCCLLPFCCSFTTICYVIVVVAPTALPTLLRYSVPSLFTCRSHTIHCVTVLRWYHFDTLLPCSSPTFVVGDVMLFCCLAVICCVMVGFVAVHLICSVFVATAVPLPICRCSTIRIVVVGVYCDLRVVVTWLLTRCHLVLQTVVRCCCGCSTFVTLLLITVAVAFPFWARYVPLFVVVTVYRCCYVRVGCCCCSVDCWFLRCSFPRLLPCVTVAVLLRWPLPLLLPRWFWIWNVVCYLFYACCSLRCRVWPVIYVPPLLTVVVYTPLPRHRWLFAFYRSSLLCCLLRCYVTFPFGPRVPTCVVLPLVLPLFCWLPFVYPVWVLPPFTFPLPFTAHPLPRLLPLFTVVWLRSTPDVLPVTVHISIPPIARCVRWPFLCFIDCSFVRWRCSCCCTLDWWLFVVLVLLFVDLI